MPIPFQVSSAVLGQIRRHGNDARTAGLYLVRRLTDQKGATIAMPRKGAKTKKQGERREWKIYRSSPPWPTALTKHEALPNHVR